MQPSYRKQEPPFCIQVELTEGCNLACKFCGINGIRAKAGGPFKFMTIETATVLASQIRDGHWNSRIEFAMHGEPTMNPDWLAILQVFRRFLPRHNLMMTSNGGGLLKGDGPTANLREAFRYLDIFALDNYEDYKIGEKVLNNLLIPGGVRMMHYPSGGPEANPHRRRKPNEPKLFSIVKDISRATSGTHATLNNHAGCAAPLNNRADGKPCAKPFREISVRWDGNIALCCNDWRGVYKIGSILETPIWNLWQNYRFNAARTMLLRGERSFTPCKGCDALSYRPGLLPDPKGLETLPKAGAAEAKAIFEALDGAPYSAPVKRSWED